MKYRINLFSPKKQNVVDRLVYFSLHYLRYIIVITQIIVIGVFFYRFKIDQDIVDIKEGLNQKQEIIKISEPLVKEVHTIESRGEQINALLGEQKKFKDTFAYILSVFPEKILLSKFIMDNTVAIHLDGTSGDPETVRIFYNRLKKDNKFKTVQLQYLKRIPGGYSFAMSLSYSVPKL